MNVNSQAQPIEERYRYINMSRAGTKLDSKKVVSVLLHYIINVYKTFKSYIIKFYSVIE